MMPPVSLPPRRARLARAARLIAGATLIILLAARGATGAPALQLNERGYFEARGLNVIVFSNTYDGLFSDAKIAGVELIHHGVRTATNGDVRLSPTPAQWDAVPQLIERRVNAADGSIEARMRYPDPAFEFTIRAEARDDGIGLSVVNFARRTRHGDGADVTAAELNSAPAASRNENGSRHGVGAALAAGSAPGRGFGNGTSSAQADPSPSPSPAMRTPAVTVQDLTVTAIPAGLCHESGICARHKILVSVRVTVSTRRAAR